MILTIKAVFLDIDGTLLTDKRSVSQSTIQVINTLKKNGIIVGLATGRGPRFVLQYLASLSLDLAIVYNGQYIISREQTLFDNPLSPKDIEGLVNYAQKNKLDLSFGTAAGVSGSGIMNAGSGQLGYRISRMVPDAWVDAIIFIFNRLVRWVRPQKKIEWSRLFQQPIYQMMMIVSEAETKKLAAEFPQLSITRSSPYSVDIISRGMSKLKGIEKAGEHYGFTTDQVMAFGDSTNDVEMLAGVRYSVAMGNGSKKVKEVASYVTASNNEDGIYQAALHFGLLEETSDVSE